MAVLSLRGRTYIYPGGLSESTGDWYVVGLVTIPVRVDSMLGWRNPPVTRNVRVTEKDRPQFVPTQAYLVIPAANLGGSWEPISDDCSFVPLSGVEQIYESGDVGRIPVTFRSAYYTNDYTIGPDELDFELREVVIYPTRIDASLGWRNPLITEEPSFVSVDVATCISGTSTYKAPLFLATKVYTWQFVPGATSSSGEGTQGPAGSNGTQGPRGFQGSVGSGTQGFQGTGFQGAQGSPGEAGIFSTTELINEINFIDFAYDYYGINYTGSTCTVYLPVANSPFDDGKTIIIESETGTDPVSIIAQGGQLIEGQATLDLTDSYATAYLIVRNGNWYNLSSAQGGTGGGGSGAQGRQGRQGFQGPSEAGFQGYQGRQGAQGVQGTQGFQGPSEAGFQGYQGRQGAQGLQGGVGPTGSGFQGPQGIQGAQGLQGGVGPTGSGFQGPQGIQGLQGAQGPQGAQGIQGTQGHEGFQGVQGNQGVQGTQGAQGPTGPSTYEFYYGATAPGSSSSAIPSPSNLGARWLDSDNGIEYIWVYDGTSYLWMQATQLGNVTYQASSINASSYSPTFSYEYYGVIYMGGICTITLPLGTVPDDEGRFINIADEVGGISGGGRGILVQGQSGQLINGYTSVLMKIDYMSLNFMFRNNSWKTI